VRARFTTNEIRECALGIVGRDGGLFAGTDYHDEANIVGAARIGEVVGTHYPRIAALATVSQRSSAAKDFQRGLGIFLAGLIATEPRRGARS